MACPLHVCAGWGQRLIEVTLPEGELREKQHPSRQYHHGLYETQLCSAATPVKAESHHTVPYLQEPSRLAPSAC